jgi:hypothetical protein
MLEIAGNSTRTCDGVTRRDLLKVGALSVGGLTLPGVLRARAEAAASGRSAKDTAVILVWQAGGPSQLDMYDLKPQAPVEIRGEFRPMASNVPGTQISEHLPLQARVMDKISIVRSVTHTNAGHGMGSHWMLTGYQPTTEVNDNIFPAAGSVVAKMRGPNDPGLPAFVTLPHKAQFSSAAYLGASYSPFTPDNDPNQDNFQVRNLRLPGRVSLDRLDRRRELLTSIDTVRRDIDLTGSLEGLDKFYVDALGMITSPKALKAFDIAAEDPRLRDLYGRNDLGQSCLLARRLVEAGVTFVQVQAGGGWDTHGNNFTELKDKLLPKFDRAVAALAQDIHDRGLADRVLVMCFGEFGRTPRINPQAGRDHWPGAQSAVFIGGGLKMGQMIGETNANAEFPLSRPASPGDVLATMYHVLGIDYHTEFYDHARRPLAVIREGEPIRELLG